MADDRDFGKYGIRPADEGFHAYDPAVEIWNESWFWDFYNADGSVAGHCRIGVFPNQRRLWLWVYLYCDGEWVALDETRLPLEPMRFPEVAYDWRGLGFAFEPGDALRDGRLQVHGRGRVVSGPRAGRIVPIGIDLGFEAVGAPHSPGQAQGEGHESAGYNASRFEQPATFSGRLTIGEQSLDFDGRGERDHSWGPRYWNMMWTFLALNHPDMQLQAVHVEFGADAILEIGYVNTDATRELTSAAYDLSYEDADLTKPVHGRFSVTTDDGRAISGTIEPVSGAEIDLAHNLDPVRADSLYRRTLIRANIDAGSIGIQAPIDTYGWLEDHRFTEGW